jgi:EF-P beta-lysylation protein EpmB
MRIVTTAAAPVRPDPDPPGSWQHAMQTAVRDLSELCRLLRLPASLAPQGLEAGRDFALFVPRSYIARMRSGDPDDPLLQQVLPRREELQEIQGFTGDPVSDQRASRGGGLLQKYHGRVLMITARACAVHCRYCFRRHFPYHESPGSAGQREDALSLIAADRSIEEVILSGGDPLTSSDAALAKLIDRLEAMQHLRRLRLHTRLPIMIPQRVTDELLASLRGTRLTPIVVIHANHANEIDGTVAEALQRILDAGIPVLNQAVLLRGVNDTADTQVELSQRLLDCRVMPYYLHQLDRVAGAAHFEVPIQRGRQIIREMRSRLPGYAVPRYVCEKPGRPHKEVIE